MIPLARKYNAEAACHLPSRNCTAYDGDSMKAAINGSDVVVVCLGTGNTLESEGHDRSDIELPGKQAQLLMDAHAAAAGS
eukprot:m.96707 g.96707  ORF g.96707 m.96707 type:complete len:80 (+) comp36922_c0_seq11:1449-1688(+)